MAKYSDEKDAGPSSIVPFKAGESWRARHKRRLKTNLANAHQLREYCQKNKWYFSIKNDGQHWIFTKKNKVIEWWSSTAKLVIDKNWEKGIHCHDYKKVIKQLERFN